MKTKMNSRKKNPRHDRILRYLSRAQSGEATVEELSKQFNVSIMTMRRDLTKLAATGRLTRTHGGAILDEPAVIEFSIQGKQSRMLEQKRAIARKAASLINEGMAISLDTGTTTLEVARNINLRGELTVLTSSLAIASALYPRDNISMVLLGGTVRKHNPDLSGPLTEENLKRFRVHLAILGVDAITPDGCFTTDQSVSRISRAMLQNADKVVVVADSSKFMQTAFVRFAELRELDMIITDPDCTTKVRAWLDKQKCEVCYAGS